MKETTLHSLVIARTLLERAEPLCNSEDRYRASAGLVILQDGIEAVFYALLIELDVDESKNLERKSFDELISELKAAGVPVPKSGTLKALNKQRVLTKHYAQVAEPVTVRTYYSAALEAIDETTTKVIGSTLRDLFIASLLQDGETKTYLQEAEKAIANGAWMDSLKATRKALFVEFEEAYSVYGWRDYMPDGKPLNLIASFLYGGYAALSWTKNKSWIDQNVKVPTDYVQIDHQHWRLEAMEFGIHTVEFENLRRLTPAAFRASAASGWSFTVDSAFEINNGTEANAKYCLDRAVSMVMKKQEHRGARRELASGVPFTNPTVYLGRMVFEKPSLTSLLVHTVSEGYLYTVHRIVDGFDPRERYYDIAAASVEQAQNTLLSGPARHFRGFLKVLPEDQNG